MHWWGNQLSFVCFMKLWALYPNMICGFITHSIHFFVLLVQWKRNHLYLWVTIFCFCFTIILSLSFIFQFQKSLYDRKLIFPSVDRISWLFFFLFLKTIHIFTIHLFYQIIILRSYKWCDEELIILIYHVSWNTN